MKHLLILSAFFITAVQLHESHMNSELNLRLQHQAWFAVTIDNQCFETPINFFIQKNTESNLSFESSKVAVINQALLHNRVTSRQVADLISTMSFESSKLELAKLAYQFTVDKQNYFLPNNTFTFEKSIMKLNNFIYRS